MANVLASVAQYEQRIIGQRTKDAVAAAKAKGILPGRRSAVPALVQARLLAEREAGLTLRKIAAGLNADRLARATGFRWSHSSVSSALQPALMGRDARKPHGSFGVPDVALTRAAGDL